LRGLLASSARVTSQHPTPNAQLDLFARSPWKLRVGGWGLTRK
jgi:hypothetical protein